MRFSHPWTQEEQELSSLVFDALFSGAPEKELAALVKALETQREKDRKEHTGF